MLLMRHIENSIFRLHKTDYAQINMGLISKEENGGITQIQVMPIGDYAFIEFNPYSIEQKHKNEGRNGYLRENKCIVCGAKDDLTVHHLFKKNVFGEDYNDHTITLCATCHVRIEKKDTRNGKNDLKATDWSLLFYSSFIIFQKNKF